MRTEQEVRETRDNLRREVDRLKVQLQREFGETEQAKIGREINRLLGQRFPLDWVLGDSSEL